MASLKLVICHFLYCIPLHVLMLKFISVPVRSIGFLGVIGLLIFIVFLNFTHKRKKGPRNISLNLKIGFALTHPLSIFFYSYRLNVAHRIQETIFSLLAHPTAI